MVIFLDNGLDCSNDAKKQSLLFFFIEHTVGRDTNIIHATPTEVNTLFNINLPCLENNIDQAMTPTREEHCVRRKHIQNTHPPTGERQTPQKPKFTTTLRQNHDWKTTIWHIRFYNSSKNTSPTIHVTPVELTTKRIQCQNRKNPPFGIIINPNSNWNKLVGVQRKQGSTNVSTGLKNTMIKKHTFK